MNKKILLLGNSDIVIYNFRLELVERLLKDGYEVHFAIPYGARVEDLTALGAVFHEVRIDRHGVNPIRDLSLLSEYGKLFKKLKPSVILGYTIKPNIYGALMAYKHKIPFIATITGLGTAVEERGWLQGFTILLYKIAFAHIQRIFTQNEENLQFFKDHKIKPEKCILIAGSGVNVDRFQFSAVPECGNGMEGEPVRFAFISRIMKEKGADLYLEAAETIKKKYPRTEFHVCGFKEEGYKGRLDELNSSGVVKYHGMVKEIGEFMKGMHCIVHPSYYPEGLSNVLLEACACGRPVITTERSGCREVVEDNGYLVPEKNTAKLISTIETFIKLPMEEKKEMGLRGRRLAENRFSRQKVVEEYMKEIHRSEKLYAKRNSAKKMKRNKDGIKLDNKTILVTGAAGFIGYHLICRLLRECPGSTIVGLDSFTDYYDVGLKEYRIRQIEEVSGKCDPDWHMVRGSIADKECINKVFGEFRPQVIVNLAAQAGVRYSIDNPDSYIESNIIGFYNVLEACRDSAEEIEHFVFASSSSVYGGNTKVPFSTDDNVDHPVSLYAATKKSDELMAFCYSKLYNIPATGLRFFTVYGPAGRPDMAYFSFTEKLRAGEKINIFNYGNCRRDFTYIDDIVEGVIRVMQGAPVKNEGEDGLPVAPYCIYNIGNSHPENLMDFVHILSEELIAAEILDRSFSIDDHLNLMPMQAGDVPVTYADTDPLELDFGFRPAVDLRTGLKEFVRWYKEYIG